MKIGTVAEANAARRDLERVVKAWCDFRDGAAKAASKPEPRTSKTAKKSKAKRPPRK